MNAHETIKPGVAYLWQSALQVDLGECQAATGIRGRNSLPHPIPLPHQQIPFLILLYSRIFPDPSLLQNGR